MAEDSMASILCQCKGQKVRYMIQKARSISVCTLCTPEQEDFNVSNKSHFDTIFNLFFFTLEKGIKKVLL